MKFLPTSLTASRRSEQAPQGTFEHAYAVMGSWLNAIPTCDPTEKPLG
jgi:hypothetical protein